MDPYIDLAKSAIKAYLKTGEKNYQGDKLPTKMSTERAGVFVSLHKKDGSLRGCVGTFLPTKKTIAEEIIVNAISAATQDPRFPPVTKKELEDLKISVDILSEPKLVKNTWEKLNPKKFGLIVSTADGRRGLLLPDISGVETAEQQIRICCQKGGIDPKEPITLEAFTVRRHHSD